MSYYHDIIMSLKDRVRRPSTCRPHPKIKFSKEEDERLRQVISHYGVQDWDVIADQMPGRNQRQCRERWMNYLSPTVNKEPFTPEEDQLLIEKYNEHGSRWVRIAKFFSGRSDTAIKNRWMALQRKILLEEEEKLAQVYEESGQLPEYGNATFTDNAKNNGRHSRTNLKPTALSRSLLPAKLPKHKINRKAAGASKLEENNQPIIQPNQQQIFMTNFNNSNTIFQPQNNAFIPFNHNPILTPPSYPQQPINQLNSLPQCQTPAIPNQSIQRKQPNQTKKQKEPLSIQKDSNVVDENDELDFWSEVFSSNEFQSNADMFNWY